MIHEDVLQAIGNTPIVRLNRVCAGLPPTIAAKLEFTNPGGSVKDRIGLAMVEAAEREGTLKPGGTIIEGTSGNTGMGLAMVAAVKGYRAIFTMPDKMSKEKIDTLRGMGAKVIVTPTAVAHDDPRSYHAVAVRLSQEIPGSFFPNQYDNPSNPAAHFRTTGPEIWEQTEGRVTHVVIGVGTGGTITGVGRYLKERNPGIKIIGVDPVGSIFYDLFRTGKAPPTAPYKVEGVGQDELPKNVDFSVIDEMYQIDDRESFVTTRELARLEGIFGGGSCGMAIAGARRAAMACGPDDLMVVLLPDSGSRYLSKIYDDDWMRENQYLDTPVHLSTWQVLSEKMQDHAQLIQLEPGATIGAAVELMRGHGISQLPVVHEGEIVGSLDENRLLRLLLTDKDAFNEPVGEFMDPPYPVVSEDTPLADLAAILEQDAPALHVKRRSGEIAIITKSDLIFALLKAERGSQS